MNRDTYLPKKWLPLLESLSFELKDKLARMDGSISREFAFAEMSNKIKVAIGVRRSGKTYLCLQKIKEFLNNGIPLSRILYINFEDDRLAPASHQKLAELLEGFYTLYPENHDQTTYLFLDEIQNVEHWSAVVWRFFDTKNVNLFLTGSSAKLLSKEIATSLRSRSIATEVWPFSFKEYLNAKNISVPDFPNAKKSLDQMRSYLLQYLTEGGFPSRTIAPCNERIYVLQELVDMVIFRDIIERHGVTNITLIKYLIKTLINNISSQFSVNKFCKDLNSQGIKASKNTIHDYLSYIEDAFLIFNVPIYSESIRKSQTRPKKIYAVDTGFYHAYTTNTRGQAGYIENFGRVFENFIYLTLRRLNREIYYYKTKNGLEVDFLTRNLEGKLHLYQVVWDTEDVQTMAREKRALEEAQEELKLAGTILTPENVLV